MSNAKKFRDSIRIMQKNGDQGTQNYIATFEQYGVISNLVIFTIRPFRESLEDEFGNWYDESISGFDTYTGAMTQIY